MGILKPSPFASATARITCVHVTKFIIATFNFQNLSGDQCFRNFLSRIGINPLNGCPSNIHTFSTFLLNHAFVIHQTNGFKLFHGHYDSVLQIDRTPQCPKQIVVGQFTNSSKFSWPRHTPPLSIPTIRFGHMSCISLLHSVSNICQQHCK